jgi:hypothetical protein
MSTTQDLLLKEATTMEDFSVDNLGADSSLAAATIDDDFAFSDDDGDDESSKESKALPRTTARPSPRQTSPSPTTAESPPPRLVSVESMGQQLMKTKQKRGRTPSETDYDVLKMLVMKKRKLSQDISPEPFSTLIAFSSTTQVASVFDRPSSSLQDLLLRQQREQEQDAATKKREIDSSKTLHSLLASDSVSESAITDFLAKHPEQASQRRSQSVKRIVWNPSTSSLEEKQVRVKYQLALHLAASNPKIPSPVIKALLKVAPVTPSSQKDGGETLLHVLLRNRPCDAELVDRVLLQHPELASVCDAKGNTPLHAAVQGATKDTEQASLQAVGQLCLLYPAAVLQTNFHGHTPLQVAQRSLACTDSIVDYLWDVVSKQF